MKNKFFLLAITFCLPIHSQGVSKSFIPMLKYLPEVFIWEVTD